MAMIRVFTLDYSDLLNELVTNDVEDLIQTIRKHVTGNYPVAQLNITTEMMDEEIYNGMTDTGGEA